MKQNIPLTEHNKKIMFARGITPEELTRDYWVKKIMQDEQQLLRILSSKFGAVDPQKRIMYKAGKLLKRNIRIKLGLPRPSGDISRQRRFTKICKELKIKLTGN
jgi:hypothetical protein